VGFEFNINTFITNNPIQVFSHLIAIRLRAIVGQSFDFDHLIGLLIYIDFHYAFWVIHGEHVLQLIDFFQVINDWFRQDYT